MVQPQHIATGAYTRPRWQKFRDQILEMRPFATSLVPWPGGQASGIKQPIERVIPGDPDFGQAIYAHRHQASELGQFNQLSWLRHLAVTGKSLHAIYAAGLLTHWSQEQRNRSFGAEAARALIALSTDAPVITSRLQSFLPELLTMVTWQAKRVFAWAPRNPLDKTLRATALLSVAAAYEGFEPMREATCVAFAEGLSGTVLPDGGHASRNSEELLKLLMLLVPLRAAMLRAHQAVPEALHQSIERMFPMLRMLCHGDGGLAHFGGARSHVEAVDAILRMDAQRGEPLSLAPHSGIARVEQAELLLLADGGDPQLQIEISRGVNRFFASHIDANRVGLALPADLKHGGEGSLLQMQVGETLSRLVYVAATGEDIRGEDAMPPESFVRLQFADDVSVLEVGISEIRFMAADTSLWVLAQRGGVFEQGTEYQRVVRLDADDPSKPSRIAWALRRIAED